MAEEKAATDKDQPKKDEDQRAPSTYEDALNSSAQRLRDTAKWLVASFAAVGAALIAGMQLKDLGGLEGWGAVLAVAGATIGIAGVVLVIACAAAVLAAGRVPMTDLVGTPPRRDDLRQLIERSPNLYQPFPSIKAFHDAISENWTKQAQAFLDYYNESKSDAEREAAGKIFESAGRFVRQFNPLNRRLLATAEFENVRSRFDTFRPWIIGGVLACAIGAGTFAYASGPAEEDNSIPAVANQPARAFLNLNDEAIEEFRGVLGEDCDPRNVPVVALEESEGNFELLTDPPNEDCKLARFEISDSEGEVTGEPLPELAPPGP